MRLKGVLAPICTPFSTDGDLDYRALLRNFARYDSAGLDGFVVAGSTGEAAFLSWEEKVALFETARNAVDGKLLVAGAGLESVRETIRLIRVAAELRYDAALVLTPHYYRGQMARPETQIQYFRAVADSAAIPIVIYNIPQNSGIDLPPDVVAELAQHSNIAGIKESSADLNKVESLVKVVPTSFPVLVGASAKFHECLRAGAAGGILAIANAAPRSARQIYDRYGSGDVAGSCAAQGMIREAAGVAPRYGIQGLKYAMDLKGYCGGLARLPLLPLDPQQKAEIQALFQNVET